MRNPIEHENSPPRWEQLAWATLLSITIAMAAFGVSIGLAAQ